MASHNNVTLLPSATVISPLLLGCIVISGSAIETNGYHDNAHDYKMYRNSTHLVVIDYLAITTYCYAYVE